LRFLCRAGMGGASVADHPLGARFDEQDAVVIFDRVLVPWSRVFVYRNREIANHLWAETKAFHQAAHQFLVKNLAKAEFVLGVTSLVAEASGADRHLHVQERLGEIVDVAETLRCFIRAAEVDAVPGPAGTLLPNPEVVETARNYFPTVYPRLIETLQIIGASGHIAHVSEAMASGPMGDIVEAHYRSATLGGRDRVRLLKLAWDMAASAFAGRQVIYERYFDGDPFRKRASRYTSYRHLDERRQHVREFLRTES
jgi:4-hydroxyphenylacetate 3-monooxygenase